MLASENKLDDLAIVEVATDKFGVGFVFLESSDGQVVFLHDWKALRCNGAKEEVCGLVVRGLSWWSREGFDEDDTVIRVGGGSMV